jgi:N6-L-threonylcarbamoyladenine synthase
MEGNPYDFSFSGLKTYIVNLLHHAEQVGETLNTDDLSAALQKAIADTVTEKTIAAAKALGYKTIALSGGVSANSCLRAKVEDLAQRKHCALCLPKMAYCTDNAAMIASEGYYAFISGVRDNLDMNAYPSLELGGVYGN